MTVAVYTKGVTVAYHGCPVVNAVDLEVRRGQWLAVIGPNGAGKSSLLKAIAGVVPFTGEVSVPTDRIAYMPQSPVLPPGMSVAEYVLLGRAGHMGWFGRESVSDRQSAFAAMERLDVAGFGSRPVTELSGGEVQRVALARAICQQGTVLVLDEPTSSLDLGHQMSVLELIESLRLESGLTVISAIHDLTAAGRFADHLAVMNKGWLAEVGPTAQVLDPDRLSQHYGSPLESMTAPDGSTVILPSYTRANH